MNIELEQKLMEEFPFMESISIRTGEKSGKSIYCECGDGWFNVIRNLCQELKDFYLSSKQDLGEIHVHQVKEKYGELRFYTGPMLPEAFDIISKYEDISKYTCDVCGEPGEQRGGYWITTRCEDHKVEE